MACSPGRRIIIADDHPVVLAGLAALLRQVNNLDVVATCCEGETALKVILELQPDLACLDVQMPKLSGVEVIQAARQAGSETQFIVLTGSVAREEFATASECGAIAIFHKDSPATTFWIGLKAAISNAKANPMIDTMARTGTVARGT